MNKRVVILHPAYWEQVMGGAEQQIYYLITFLVNSGCEVHYIFENNGKEFENNLNINLHPLNKIRISKRFGNKWFLYRRKIDRLLKEIEPDTIYTRLYSSWSGIASAYGNKNNCKHIWALASDSDVSIDNSKTSLFKPLDFIEKKWIQIGFSKADFFLSQNSFQQEKLWLNYGRKSIKIMQSAALCEEGSILKEDLPIKVLWIANLKVLKQPQIFINLVKRFSNQTNIHFTMIGRSNKNYKDLLTHAVSSFKNFSYEGELTNNEVNKHLLKSHILINTSDYEGFSNTFVQAWMRKVVVMSLNSNPDQILTRENIGFLCNNLDEMEKKLKFLIGHPEKIKEMGQQAYVYGRRNHSLEKNFSLILKSMGINE